MRILFLAAALFSLAAFAQTEKAKAPAPTQQRQAPKPQMLIFEDGSEIDGRTLGPDVMTITGTRRPDFGNMIKVRTSFADKLLDSVNEL